MDRAGGVQRGQCHRDPALKGLLLRLRGADGAEYRAAMFRQRFEVDDLCALPG